MVRKGLKKILCTSLLLMLIFNFIASSIYASTTTNTGDYKDPDAKVVYGDGYRIEKWNHMAYTNGSGGISTYNKYYVDSEEGYNNLINDQGEIKNNYNVYISSDADDDVKTKLEETYNIHTDSGEDGSYSETISGIGGSKTTKYDKDGKQTVTSDVSIFDDVVDGIAGILLFPAKLLPLAIGEVIRVLLGNFSEANEFSLLQVLFNQVPDQEMPILNVNFFTDVGKSNGTAEKIRDSVGVWYTSIRNIAAVILVLIAIYISIRMAISTIADDQAKYKKMLIDWLTSLALLFVLHIIMRLIIAVNDTFVNILYDTIGSASGTDNVMSIESDLLHNGLFTISFVQGMGNSIAFLMLEVVALIFFIMYLKRMITLAFLTIIAPLVTVTYSVDKVKDGRSQALDTWLKEYAYNVLIQPFHCIAYLALGGVAVTLLDQKGEDVNLGSAIIGIAFLVFILQSEKIVKKIFGFQSESLGDALGTAAFMTSLYNKGNKDSKGTEKAKSAEGNKFADAIEKGGSTPSAKPRTSSNEKLANDTRKAATASGGSGGSGGSGKSSKLARTTVPTGGYSTESEGKSKKPSKLAKAGEKIKDSKLGEFTEKTLMAAENFQSSSRGRKVLQAGGKWLAMNKLIARTATGLAIGGATGTLQGTYAGVSAGYKKGKDAYAQQVLNTQKRGIAASYEAAKRSNPGQTQEYYEDLARGEIDPTTDEEKEFVKYMNLRKNTLKKQGMSEKDINKQIPELIENMESGEIDASNNAIRTARATGIAVKRQGKRIKGYIGQKKAARMSNKDAGAGAEEIPGAEGTPGGDSGGTTI